MITRDLQRLGEDGFIKRAPTQDEWARIWKAADDWATLRGEEPEALEGESIEDFILQQAPNIFVEEHRRELLIEIIDGRIPHVWITLKRPERQ